MLTIQNNSKQYYSTKFKRGECKMAIAVRNEVTEVSVTVTLNTLCMCKWQLGVLGLVDGPAADGNKLLLWREILVLMDRSFLPEGCVWPSVSRVGGVWHNLPCSPQGPQKNVLFTTPPNLNEKKNTENQQSSLLDIGGACRLKELKLCPLEFIEFSNNSNTS